MGASMPGGYHPPFTHVPSPNSTNGSGVMQPPGTGGGGGVGTGAPMPGGYHPPFTHVPPPNATNGSGVAHPPDVGVGVGVGVGDGADGGNHPPSTHRPPPSARNGSGVEQPPTYVIVVPGAGTPGGSQPPSKHTLPPKATNGSGVTQPPRRVSDPPEAESVPIVSLAKLNAVALLGGLKWPNTRQSETAGGDEITPSMSCALRVGALRGAPYWFSSRNRRRLPPLPVVRNVPLAGLNANEAYSPAKKLLSAMLPSETTRPLAFTSAANVPSMSHHRRMYSPVRELTAALSCSALTAGVTCVFVRMVPSAPIRANSTLLRNRGSGVK
jgi:hypothetical protein